MQQTIYAVLAVILIFGASVQASGVATTDVTQNEIAVTPMKHLKKLTYLLMDPKFNVKDYSPALDIEKLLTLLENLRITKLELQSRQERDIKSIIEKVTKFIKMIVSKIKGLL